MPVDHSFIAYLYTGVLRERNVTALLLPLISTGDNVGEYPQIKQPPDGRKQMP